MKQAIRPNYFDNFSLESTKPIEKSIENDAETTALYAMSQSAGWKILKEVIKNIENDLDSTVVAQMQSGMSLEEIGRSTVVKEIVKNVLHQLTNRVEDTRESVESRGKTNGGDEESR